MANHGTEAVIAGSKSFALALLAPLTERVGTRPRIAADPGQAVGLTGGRGLVVVEFQGERSLEAIRRLRDEADGLAVIAAVPDGNATVEETLRSLGVESARWDGRPDEVLAAVSRHLEVSAPAAAAAPLATPPADSPPAESPPTPARAPAADVPLAASAVGALFDDMELGAEEPPPAAIPAASLRAPAAPTGDWPGNVPGAVEAGDALAMAAAGVFPPEGSPLAIVAEVMAGMSAVERGVLLGEPQPVDPAPVRDAAVMRLRVAVAVASAPPPGAPIDAGAVSTLLGEIDALLTKVNALLAAAPPELQPPLEQVRNALVKDAIDFSEAAHRAASDGAAVEQPAASAATAAARRAKTARLVSVTTAAERDIEQAERKRQRWLWVVLVLAAAAAGVFHGERWMRIHRGADAPPTRVGAPADAVVTGTPVPGSPVVIQARNGRALTPEELKKIEDAEALRGNAVQVVGQSVIVLPGAAAGGQPGAPAPAPGQAGAGAPPAAR